MTINYGETPIENMLSPKGLAEVLDVSRRHLDDLRREDPTFPQQLMLGRLPRWCPVVIWQWTEGTAALALGDEAEGDAQPTTPRAERTAASAAVSDPHRRAGQH
ncbi:hypothetical protein [Pimelobacter simplex]|uniref:hypothetical protein n=1 Tax=Nocardioides simplex TaxID=2045 RepID=UPI003AAB70D0